MVSKKHHKHHERRPELAGEHKLADIGQIVCLVSFLVVWILDSFIFQYSNFFSQFVPWWVLMLIATPIWCFAGYLAYNGMKSVFGKPQEKPGVISEGVFKISRHPIYLGAILVYVGWIVSTLSLLSLGVFALIILFYNCVANFEEKLLLEKFGVQYEEYQQEVPKWGIRLIKKKIEKNT
ncbi:MAG: methyltransferase family protein [Promethearchaeota archaeon]